MVTDTMADTHSRSISASEVVSLATEPYSLSFTKDSNRRKSNNGVYKATKHSDTPTLTASIPSKYQTFFTSSNEPCGFNSCTTRFNSTTETENPGPGTYGSETNESSLCHRTESFSKKGTGGLASDTKRFPRTSHQFLGPGSYNPTLCHSHVDFNRSQYSRNFKSPIVKKSTTNNTNSSIAPAPNTYNIECSKDRSSVTVPSFKSKSIRDGLSLKTIQNPGPGQYNPKDTLLHRNVCTQRASFLSKTNRGESLINKNGAGPGPTDYATVPVTKTRPLPYYRQKHYLCISAPAIPLPAIPPPPGPGHYEIVDNNTDKIQLVTGAVFKSTSSRWSQTHHNELPGPGAYEPKLIGKRSFYYNTNHQWV